MNQSNFIFSMAYKMQWHQHGVYVKYNQIVTSDEIREVDDKMYSDQKYSNLRYQIIDFLDVKETTITDDDVAVIAGYEIGSTIYNREMKIAFVADNPLFIKFIYLYMDKLKATSWIIKLFDNLADAENWCC